ncbi:hypothetical protein ASS64_14445 [Erythrobacter sp. AP23]|nr:hypothetical protein ASS64_14445 [Erythrobacter sp. AP23]
MSKIENGQISPTYDHLIRLSDALEIDLAELFDQKANGGAVTPSGRRSINRRGEGKVISDSANELHYLSTDLLKKGFIPIFAHVNAKTIEEYGPMLQHSGEEFIFVVEGTLEFHSDHYAPVTLHEGDSMFFDSMTAHAYVAKGDLPCRILSICSPHRHSAGSPEDNNVDTGT